MNAPIIDREMLTKAIDTWYSTLSDEILDMWRVAAAGNHKPRLAMFAADQAHDTLMKSITRSVEETKVREKHASNCGAQKLKRKRGVKSGRRPRGVRTIQIGDSLCELLRRERDRHLRLIAGVPDGVSVDLALVRLPEDALCFPAIGASLTTLRAPNSINDMFVTRAKKLGFEMRFHDLRGTHSTILLDKGVPVHVVAKRIGDW